MVLPLWKLYILSTKRNCLSKLFHNADLHQYNQAVWLSMYLMKVRSRSGEHFPPYLSKLTLPFRATGYPLTCLIGLLGSLPSWHTSIVPPPPHTPSQAWCSPCSEMLPSSCPLHCHPASYSASSCRDWIFHLWTGAAISQVTLQVYITSATLGISTERSMQLAQGIVRIGLPITILYLLLLRTGVILVVSVKGGTNGRNKSLQLVLLTIMKKP